MKIAPYVEKLGKSQAFKQFMNENSDAYVAAGFFILDLEGNHNVHQIDYYIPKKKKIAAFTLDKEVTLQVLDLLNSKTPEKLDIKTKIDLEAIKGIVEDEMKNRNLTDDIKKIIAIIQNIDGKRLWNVNCVLSGMGILKAHVDDSSQSVLMMDKSSILDMVKKVNLKDMKSQAPVKSEIAHKPTRQELKDELEKLNKLEEAIEKEKSEVKKKIEKN
ncbi:MAG: hypothetical protein AABW80_00815 [Nanoarchaeota archaeon]